MAVKILQFGEGNFLRAFADWMLDALDCEVTIVQPIEKGLLDVLAAQGYQYHVLLRGLEGGHPVRGESLITCVKDGINPFTQWDKYLAFARDPELRVIVSNTTESGIEYRPEPMENAPRVTFPGKLALFLKARFDAEQPPLLLLPCELIEANGQALYTCVKRYADDWDFGEGFLGWLDRCSFCDTLVDRIVTGYPKDVDTRGDRMYTAGESFHLWVIQGDHEDVLPLRKAGFNVIWTDDVTSYRARKVRILNGAHTALTPYALLRGFETVGDCMKDPALLSYLKACIYQEILPTLPLPEGELLEYADRVLERFQNPFLEHRLSSIALNSFDKFRVRVMPSIRAYEQRYGQRPRMLMRSFDALCAFYKTDMAEDAPEILAFMRSAAKQEVWERLC